jgi:AcrR family transcriptional regulator
LIAKAKTKKKQSDILNIAGKLFLERGYDAVSLDDILGCVGGSKTTLYSYYGCKEGLFAASVEKICRDKLHDLLAMDVTHLEPKAGLNAIGKQFLSILSDTKGSDVFRAMIAEAQRFPDLAAAFFAAGPESIIALLRRHIQHWQKQGLLRRGNAEMLAVQFLGLVMGNFHLKRLLGIQLSLTQRQINVWVAQGTDVFLEGIGNRRQ